MKKGLNINSKRTEYMVVSKGNSTICKIQIGDTERKVSTIFRYLGSVLLEGGKSDTEIRKRILNDGQSHMNKRLEEIDM